MDKYSVDKSYASDKDPEHCFWESELYFKSYFRNLKSKTFNYYDNANVFRYLFYHWVNKWAYALARDYIEPYKYHPLPVADQVLHWLPVFSKHISDGLVRLENYETAKARSGKKGFRKPYKSVLLRALLLTFWKRFLILGLALVATNILTLSISMVVKKLLQLLSAKSISFVKTSSLLLAIIGVQIADGLFIENITFYIYRLMYVVHYLASMTVFQHGLCHRRNYVNSVDGHNILNVCNQVLHSCSPDSECSKNPLFCPALRYQNKDISPKVFTFEWKDSYYVSQSFESVKYIIEFLTNFSYGVYLLSLQIKVNIWVLYGVVLFFTLLMLFFEVISTFTIKFTLYMRDYKITKCTHIFPYLPLIKKMLYDDIAINTITQSRNDELSLIVINLFLMFFNGTLFVSCANMSFYIIQRYFIKTVTGASVITDIDTAGYMTTFYIFLRIISSMFLIPRSIKIFAMSIVSFRRTDKFLFNCSPNFYISENKFTGSTKTSNNIVDITNQLPTDAVVYYKDATFTWVNSREDFFNKKYEPYLKNINFELKRGQMAIVTGSQGSGKSNFIKSLLGEMTLISGSMAVVPLHTSMPIFYASQDIWLQHGTIRSNITFGYKFDEDIYNIVLRAVELEYDISTWEKGDLRVVSDNAHSLSGGQRVRMELARAVYAYLIFHKVNVEYNKGKCTFLMCLDSSFHGLDPYVSKTIFNNLFNTKSGLLIKDDLSLVLASSKQSLDTCSKVIDLMQLANPPIYKIKHESLRFESHLHDFVRNKKKNSDFTYLSENKGPLHMNRFTDDMLALCSSGANSRTDRFEKTRNGYNKSFKSFAKDHLSTIKLNRYGILLRTATFPFLLYILLTTGHIVMDNVKFVFATRLSDHITKNIKTFNDGGSVDLEEIKSRGRFSLRMITLFISGIISLSFIGTVTLTSGCVLMSRNIHEYVVNSIFKNSSSVIKIKKQINQVITYFTCDIINMDDVLGLFISLILMATLRFLINIITLFYLIPISIPFFVVSLSFILYFILVKYVLSTQLMFYGYFETCLHVNVVLEDAISGSSINRSFKKDSDFDTRFFEQRDYKSRCKFLLAAISSWSTITLNWVLSFTTLLVLVIPIILNKYTKYNLKVGYFGLGLSLCMNVYRSFNFFSNLLTSIEMVVVSLERFKYFVPPGQKLKFEKFLNTHEEFLVNPTNKSSSEINRTQLLRRRAIEFKAENRKFYGLRKLFYHPKLQILDVGRYLTPDHSGVELNDVCVYTSFDRNPEGMILKHISASASKSDIIGMVGRTGAGKTTLLSVLQNIIANRTGQVLLDRRDLDDIPKVVLRQIIGVLPQLPFAFKGWTIRRFLDPRKLFSDSEINDALNKCGLLNFVNYLPGGLKLDTVIVPEEPVLYYLKNKGSKSRPITFEKERSMSMGLTQPGFDSDALLSNSQLRTLWLARLVLYRHFYRMIVVDEPPEEDLEQKNVKIDELGVPIYDLLQKYFSHCTTFVTAHDVSVLKNCTSVWVIHDGNLIRTCKTSEISANESIANIIEESVKSIQPYNDSYF